MKKSPDLRTMNGKRYIVAHVLVPPWCACGRPLYSY